MLKHKKIVFIGSGNMGEALIRGLVQSGVSEAKDITCTDILEDKLAVIREKYGIKTSTNNIEAVGQADIIVLAVKPQIIARVLGEIKNVLDRSCLIISIAAGVSLSTIESCIEKELRLIRVMPNVGVAVGAGAAAISGGKHIVSGDLDLAREIFDSVGESVFVPESLMDAVTGLSGSGPAYVFMVIDALADGGVKAGIPKPDALKLAAQTVFGAALLMKETGDHPAVLKDMVTSPGGTTIAGIHAMENGGLRAALMNGVEAAAERSRELGKQ